MDIRHIAKLAALRLEEEEAEKLAQDMEAIVAMAEALPDFARGLQPDAAEGMTLRNDVPSEDAFARETMLQNAPRVQDGCVVVPRTVE